MYVIILHILCNYYFLNPYCLSWEHTEFCTVTFPISVRLLKLKIILICNCGGLYLYDKSLFCCVSVNVVEIVCDKWQLPVDKTFVFLTSLKYFDINKCFIDLVSTTLYYLDIWTQIYNVTSTFIHKLFLESLAWIEGLLLQQGNWSTVIHFITKGLSLTSKTWILKLFLQKI